MPSWSSEISSSRSDTSMPAETTPRTGRASSVMPVPGMKLPSGANTPIMPDLALGAPHTTSTMPLPVSTLHTFRRSALGCGFASSTRAMVKGASFLPGSSMLSTSSPMAESLSASASTGTSVSRWSLSQDSVNFMAA